MLAILIGDIAYAIMQQTESYVEGSWVDVTWPLGYALMAAAAVHPSMRTMGKRTSEPAHVGAGRVVLAALALLVAPMVTSAAHAMDVEPEPVMLAAAAVGIVALVVWRQLRLVRGLQEVRDRVAEQEAYYRALATNSSDAYVLTDDQAVVVDVSAAMLPLLGWAREDSVGVSALGIVHRDDLDLAAALLDQAVRDAAGTHAAELRVLRADGSWTWVEARATNLLETPAVGGIVVNVHDIDARKRAENELAHQAFHDSLTGLANRALFRDRIAHALQRGARGGQHLAVLFCDLDGFKTVNDSLGHGSGDELLRVVAGRLTSAVRDGDTVARLGGDEFAVLLEGDETLADEATVVAERLLCALSDPVEIEGTPMVVTGSIGIATTIPSATSPGATTGEELLRNADTAMYGAKTAGRNRWVVYESRMRSAAVNRLALEADLRHALDRDQLVLHYQPVIELESRRLTGFEALIRWEHPVRGLVAPADFISVAEDTGMIVEIGRWVVRAACHAATEWRAEAPDADLTVAVNLSPRQLEDPGIVADVAEALARSGLPAHALALELTESVLVSNPGEVAGRLAELKALGVRIAIDDFGTGYSSLSYLRRFPVDILKIDRSFIEMIEDPARLPAIVRGLLELGRTLELDTVAEGIELPTQHTSLVSEGCHLGQGYLFARPLDGDAAMSLVAQHRADGRIDPATLTAT
jgi:diguanylate cyclase (GGDEF)-like protein/PAS domain S-box-containing protein